MLFINFDIYAYIWHPSGWYSIASRPKILKFYIKIHSFWSVSIVYCLRSSSMYRIKEKGFCCCCWKKPNFKRSTFPFIEYLKSYYYFAIIFDLDPSARSIGIVRNQPQILLMKWHFDEYNNKTGQTKKKKTRLIILWNLIIYDFRFVHIFVCLIVYLFLIFSNAYIVYGTDDILKTMGK